MLRWHYPDITLQVELGKVEDLWSMLLALAKYLDVEPQAHWLLMWKETNHLHDVNDDVIILKPACAT